MVKMIERCYSSLFFVACAFAVLVQSVPLDNEIKENDYDKLFTEGVPKSVTSFAIDLLQNLVKDLRPEQNVLTSPFNAYAALLMLHLGAAGGTRDSLNEVLKLHESNRDFTKLHETFRDIFRKIDHVHSSSSNEDEAAGASLANGFFMQKNHPIRDTYIQSLKKYYAANATNVDFAAHADRATEVINSFISEGTNKRIDQFYKDVVSPRTVAVLVSALYFHGQWMHPFSADETQQEKFHTGNGEIDVPMMQHREKVEYTYSDALQFEFIELKYKGGDYAMLLTLPRPGQTVKNLTEHFHLIDHREVSRNAKMVVVDYKIPKMKFSWEKSLVGPLHLSDVFRSADLSQMTTGKVPISEMIQATEMEVDEHGTIATAVTSIGLGRRLKPKPQADVKFYVDRPFFVSIVHRPTNMLLFNGIVQKPIVA